MGESFAPMSRPPLLLGLLVSLVALAEPTFFIRTRNARVQKTPGPTGEVLVILQPGAKVEWLGPDSANPKWHKVTTAKGDGFVLRAALSETPPQKELTARDGGAPVEVEAFVSSGAGVRAFTEAATSYSKEKVYFSAYDQLLVSEAIARAVTDEKLAAHARDAGLEPVVGGAP